MSDLKAASRELIQMVPAPAGEGRWVPLSHDRVATITEEAIAAAGFTVEGSSFSLTHSDHRMFGTYRLASELAPGVRLQIGCRNSTDKEFAMAFCAGESVMVCSNGCMWADLVVSRKHTTNCEAEFISRIAERMATFPQVVTVAQQRLDYLRTRTVTMGQIHDVVCRGVKADVFAPSEAFKVIEEYEHPSFEEQGGGTLWGLHNAATHVFKTREGRNPLDWQTRCAKLQQLLLPEGIRAQMTATTDQSA